MDNNDVNKMILRLLGKFVTILLLIYALVVAISSISYEALNGFYYFTNQSNLLIIIVLVMYLLKKENSKTFKYLSFVTLVSITMTALIYHLLLTPVIDPTEPLLFRTGIQSLMSHTINPVLYIMFYFFINKTTVKLGEVYLGLIHPLLYFAYFLITGPFTNFYPYDFIDVSKNGIWSVLGISAMIIPIVLGLSLGLIALKRKLVKGKDKIDEWKNDCKNWTLCL